MAKSTFLLLVTLAYLQYCSARALAGPVNQRLLLILMDGLRYDYLNQTGLALPGFQEIISAGAKPDAFIPDFPTSSYPNYYTIMTGLHTESHGMTGNFMYDYTRKEAFLIGTNPEQYNAHWWDGGDPLWTTAVRQKKKVHMYYWPGCEVEIHGLRATNCTPYTTVPTMSDFKRAVNTSLDVLKNRNTDVAAIYFELTDSVGHSYGPFSTELNQVLLDLDPVISDLYASLTLDPELSNVNLMIFSDHGMTPVSQTRVINLTSILVPEDYEAVLDYGAYTSIYTRAGKENEVYAKLENFHPNLTVYRKNDLPDRWLYKHGKYVAPLTAVCDKGWFVVIRGQGHVKVTSRSCQGHVKVTPKSRQGHTKVTSRSRQGHIKVTPRSRQGHAKVTSRSRRGHVKVTSRSRQGLAKVTPWSRQVHIKVTPRSQQGHAKVTSRSRQGRVKVISRSRQGHIKVMSRSCQGHVKVTSKSCQGPVKVTSRSCQGHAKPVKPEYPVRKEDGRPKLGGHGYDSKETDMYGTFLGMGPAFHNNTKTPPIHMVDAYQVMCDILRISASPNNGSSTRVAPLLREATGSSSMTSPHLAVLVLSCLMVLLVAVAC